ncbi:hormogonium polysaccharide biosynthesis glycosyltransferase HpsE [Pantanalinema sp. GBBB05]|uniref:hormogonium polysaccharide biosynthesis glycosyltransferase HpsE n=1 Tax=Pantanalinema sp. GBBB05 TaxID=2604139 RepID=UPI003D819DB9
MAIGNYSKYSVLSLSGIMGIDFTVAIRVYNSAQRLPGVLDRLLQQIDTEGIAWEVLIIDNNSQDNTPQIAADYAKRWQPSIPFRYIIEPRQGRSFARERAIREAASDLVGFLDDDNLPSETWVAAAFRFGQAHPHAGAYGGNVYPLLEGEPPADFDQVKHLLAISDRGPNPYLYTRAAGQVPIGPGCVFRKRAWQAAVPTHRRLQGVDDPRKVRVSGAEDVEALYYILSSGWEIWHNPEIEIWHQIPPRRLERDYLLRMARNSGLAAHAWRIAKLKPWQRPFMPLLVPFYLLLSGSRVGLLYLKHRQNFATNLAVACLFESRMGNFLSPFLTPPPISYEETAPFEPIVAPVR